MSTTPPTSDVEAVLAAHIWNGPDCCSMDSPYCECGVDMWREEWVAHVAAALRDVTRSYVDGCHCGKPVAFGYDGDDSHHRGMCAHCDAVRCDAHPGTCEALANSRTFLGYDATNGEAPQ